MPARRLHRKDIPWRDLPMLRVSEVADLLAVDKATVEGLIAAGTITTRTIGQVTLVETASVVRWIDGEAPRARPRARPSVRAAVREMRSRAG